MPERIRSDHSGSVVVVKKDRDQKLTIITESEHIEPVEGRDEMNVIELPFSLVSYRNSQKIKTMESRWRGNGEDGKTKDFYKIVTSSDQWGLPTFQAEEVLIAALEVTHKQGFADRKVNTNKYELMRLMNWSDTGRYRKALINAFSQIVGTTIATNHFWDNEKKRYAEVGFHIMDEFRFYEDDQKRAKEDHAQLALSSGYFIWGDTLWKSMETGYIKRLDTATYFSLKAPLSRRLYRYADKHLHGGGVEIDLFRLAFDKLVMAGNYKYPSEVSRKLKPSIQELNNRGLADIRIVKSKTPSGFKIVIRPPKSPKTIKKPKNILKQSSSATAPETDSGAPEEPSADDPTTSLAQRLIERGIRPRAAAQLVKDYPDRIARQTEFLDFLLNNPNDIESPAAYLRKRIEENWTPPKGFVAKTESEENRQPQDPVEQELSRQYLAQKEQIILEVDATMKLSRKQRVMFKVEEWETTQRKRRMAPTPKEREKRHALYIKNLPTRDQELTERLENLRRQFEQKAQEQGIENRDWIT